MIFFFGGGGFGNQLFQYAFLNTIRRENERVFSPRSSEIFEYLDGVDLLIVDKKKRVMRGICRYILPPLFKILSKVKIINLIQVNHEKLGESYKRELPNYTLKKGVFSQFTFVEEGYFQSELFFNEKVLDNIRVKRKYIEKAEKILKEDRDENYPLFFIHLRRGDYRTYKILGKETLLPISFFKKCIGEIKREFPHAQFILLSDEPRKVFSEFNDDKSMIISRATSPQVDFAIMTLCDGAVLSPSSFSWWGSYFISKKLKIYAPKYWLGFNSKIEYQKNALADYMTEVEI